MKQSNLLIAVTVFIGIHNICAKSFKIYNYKSNINIISESGDPEFNGEYLLIDTVLNNNSLVFDVGANVGEYTKYVLSLDRRTKVYSFEPIAEVVSAYKNNLNHFCNTSENNCNVFNFKNSEARIFEMGFYKISTEMPIWYAYTQSGLSSIYDRSSQELFKNSGISYKKENIILSTIDDFCLKQGIDKINFLKIDVEGAEYDVLLGASRMLIGKMIDYIQFEYGGTYLDAGYKLKQVYDCLRCFGYHIYKIMPDGLMYIDQWHKTLENYKYSNFLAVDNLIKIK